VHDEQEGAPPPGGLSMIEAGLASAAAGEELQEEPPVEVAVEEPAPAPPAEQPGEAEGAASQVPAEDPQARAAEALAAEDRKLPGLVPEVIGGATIAEVTASLQAARKAYSDVRAAVLKEQGEAQGAAVPPARSGAGPAPVPTTPLAMIEAGVAGARPRAK
jgi:hypothetical protein